MDMNFTDETQVGSKMTVAMTDEQRERLIAAMQDGGREGAAGAVAAVGHMGPCNLGKDKVKRPKRWSDWRKDAKNKMRFLRIEEDEQKLNFVRSCAGAELTEFWEKEVRARFEAKVEEGARVEAHTRWWRTPIRPSSSW